MQISNILFLTVIVVAVGAVKFTCDFCQYTSSKRVAMKDHVLASHLHIRQFKCDICDRAFTRKTDCLRHTWTHQKPQVECNVCHSFFSRKDAMLKHQKKMHRTEDCSICGTPYVLHHEESAQHLREIESRLLDFRTPDEALDFIAKMEMEYKAKRCR